MTHFYHRADQNEIKLTFKFDGPVQWRDSTPDPYHIAVDIAGATNALDYPERPMYIGPLSRIIFRETEEHLRLWLDLRETVRYEIYDEAGGTLVTIILHGPFAPAPVQEPRYSFDFRDAEVRDVLLALAKAAGVNIVIDDTVTGTLTLSFEELTFDQALGYILTVRGLGMVQLADNIIVAERQWLEEKFGLLESRRFALKYIDPAAARQSLLLFFQPDRVIADPATRSIFVKGREGDLYQAQQILQEIDVALETRVFPLDNNIYQHVEQLQKIAQLLQIIIPDPERIQYDFFQRTILVRGTREELEAAAELIKNIDRRRPQIMIDAKLVEINRQKTKDLGVSWFVGGREGEITFGELLLGGTLERQETIEMKITALEKDGLARLVGNPRILTLSGKTAYIKVGDRVPYRQPIITEEEIVYELLFLDVGISLEVTPSLTPEGQILVHAIPNVSTFTIREYVLGGLTYADPQTRIKTADTTARLRNGETLVIGGLIRSEDLETITRIPILSEIPFLGELFILRNRTQRETELIMFLTPHLVEF
ncbi:MAG TPA: hypothetical protein VLH40_05280 [Atribacteraceae bacterium]|nr:hypothetical protein [Atribacteraceae bacterium]